MANNPKIRRRITTPTDNIRTTLPLLDETTRIHEEQEKPYLRYFVSGNKINAFWGPVFIAFWILLYNFTAIPAFHRLPKSLTIEDEAKHPNRFIAERAEIYLRELISIGPRVVGSVANEQTTITYFLNTLAKLKKDKRADIHIETDIQIASGSYIHWEMINMYQGVQNFLVKLGPKASNTTSYLLVNSHYDSVPGGPGAGDDGAMVCIMLEIIRVLSKSKPLRNSVVFLFNGAEENPLQASHAFVTQHQWAKNARALINLDSAGSGGRELLFQSSPNFPWLMKYYSMSVMHPYASTIAEEMFQRHFIPSDTDFRIFRDHGKVPGVDMAHQYNGYVYHTKFDRAEIVPRGTLQNTGDNVLALVKALANAPELGEPSDNSHGNTVFFDVMGFFLIFYSEKEGIILNSLVCVVAVISIGASLVTMSNKCGVPIAKILNRLVVMFALQNIACTMAITITFLMGILMDVMHMPLAWFTHSWLIFGLYFCPLIFGLGIIPCWYFSVNKEDPVPLFYRVRLLMHANCLVFVLLTIVMTASGIRSAFIFMIMIAFYTTSLVINLITGLHNRPLTFLIAEILCQIFPFLLFTYMAHGVFTAFIPMTGRFGSDLNPELIICALVSGVGIFCGTFLVPLLNMFKRTKALLLSLLAITVLFVILAATPLGFPFRPETSVQRFSILHTKRIFHELDTSIRKSDSGYFILPNDRRTFSVKEEVINMTAARTLLDDCQTEVFCGLPIYNHRWHKARSSNKWIPAPSPVFDKLPELKLVSQNKLSKDTIRFEWVLTGPDHMSIFINPLNGAHIIDWTFHKIPLSLNWKPPYFVYFSYGADPSPLKFWVDLKKPNEDWSTANIEVVACGHWNHHTELETEDFKKFLRSFPDYADIAAWPSTLESWKF